jgi:hypothetical protein
MRRYAARFAVPAILIWGLMLSGAFALPGQGPRETVDQRFTTQRTSTPTGLLMRSEYHAPGDREGAPPYMRRMVFYPPGNMHYDTRVPARCTAPDAVLQVQGPEACPPKSLIGIGETEGIFMVPGPDALEFHRFWHRLYVLNNTNEQILLVKSEGYTVIRGKIRRDGAIVFEPTTCFPSPPNGCADDYIIQLKNSTRIPRITRRINGRLRSYARTPRHCPHRGSWRSVARFVWADGSVDNVVTRQPCRRR